MSSLLFWFTGKIGMNEIAKSRRWFRSSLTARRVELGLCIRVTISAVVTLVASHLLGLRIPLWAVLTAVILTQLNIGRSLKATTDYFIGTLGAATYAGAVGVLIPQPSEIWLSVGLTLAVAPTTLLAAINPRLSAAPFTAVLVFLAPTIAHVTPVGSAIERLLEVAIGGSVGLVVSLLVFPARAHDLAVESAAHTLNVMAQLQLELFAKFAQPFGGTPVSHVQDKIGEAFAKFDMIALDAKHERLTHLTTEPDQSSLARTMLRLRHDLIMIGRAGLVPLPKAFQARLGPRIADVGTTAADYLHECASALLARRGPPAIDAFVGSLDSYVAEMAALRHEGLTRNLPVNTVEQIFTLSFALDQLRLHFNDLARRVAELSRPD
jgi:uncharacterized membrane protein YccC